MRPLIDESSFDEMRRIRDSYRGSLEAAHVFVPVGPEPNENAPQILFVGQATRGMVYDDDFGYREAAATCDEERVVSLRNSGRLLFFNFIKVVCRQVIRTAGLDKKLLEEMDRIVGWSNLMKIGSAEGNPGPELVAAQKDACVTALKSEILTMKPVATVFISGDRYAREILYPAMGSDGWNDNVEGQDRVAVKQHPKCGHLIWADHPRTMRAGGFEQEVVGFVAGYIAGLVVNGRQCTQGQTAA